MPSKKGSNVHSFIDYLDSTAEFDNENNNDEDKTKFIDDSIINIAFGDDNDKSRNMEVEKVKDSQNSTIISDLVQKVLSELDLSKDEMDRILSSNNVQSDKAISLLYQLNNLDTSGKDRQQYKKVVEM